MARTRKPADEMLEMRAPGSDGPVENLEKVTKIVQELPQKYEGAMNDLFKAPPPKPSLVTKVAMGMSALSIVLSLLSISLAQSTRQAVLNRDYVTAPRHGSSVAYMPVAPPPAETMPAPAPEAMPTYTPAPQPRRVVRKHLPSQPLVLAPHLLLRHR